jgi:hypothetical protein
MRPEDNDRVKENAKVIEMEFEMIGMASIWNLEHAKTEII